MAGCLLVPWWFFNITHHREAWRELQTSLSQCHSRSDRLVATGHVANTLSWKYKDWPNLAVFLRTQRTWSWAVTGILLALPIGVVGLVLVGLFQGLAHS